MQEYLCSNILHSMLTTAIDARNHPMHSNHFLTAMTSLAVSILVFSVHGDPIPVVNLGCFFYLVMQPILEKNS